MLRVAVHLRLRVQWFNTETAESPSFLQNHTRRSYHQRTETSGATADNNDRSCMQPRHLIDIETIVCQCAFVRMTKSLC